MTVNVHTAATIKETALMTRLIRIIKVGFP
jgi:hypothetical protein